MNIHSKDEEHIKEQSGKLMWLIKRIGKSSVGTVMTWSAYIVVTPIGHYICDFPVYWKGSCAFFSTEIMGWLVAFATWHGIEITFRTVLMKSKRSKNNRVNEVQIKDKLK
jgi:hypothetical protein